MSSQLHSQPESKPIVIGLYGISGCGKTYFLNQLRQRLGEERFTFHDGSTLINTVFLKGIEAFKHLPEEEKVYWRECAIDNVRKECSDTGKVAIVTGHLMLWSESDPNGRCIHTQKDMDTYTHIISLWVNSSFIDSQRRGDKERTREPATIAQLERWQNSERAELKPLCLEHSILYTPFRVKPLNPLTAIESLVTLVRDFSIKTEEREALDLRQAEQRLDEIVSTHRNNLETMLVLDADKTSSDSDTGELFWTMWLEDRHLPVESPLRPIFSGPLGSTYQAFRQAMLLYEECGWSLQPEDGIFRTICNRMVKEIFVHPDIVSLLRLVLSEEHVGAVIVTCGLASVWEQVLQKVGLASKVKVIGASRIAEGFVVTPRAKAALVTRLREKHRLYVCAFGDSPLDLGMMQAADQAIVVVGEEKSRSKSMEAQLEKLVDEGVMPEIHQVVFPQTAAPRLGGLKVKPINLRDPDFLEALSARRPARLEVHHASTKAAAKLLMTPMRDSANSGPILRRMHAAVGRYLALEFLGDIIGLEAYPITHVLGHVDSGFRLDHEKNTLIVALMRGGESMAFGVNEVFPLASFLHANSAEDIKNHHLEGKRNLILVDSVINEGKTVIQFMSRIRKTYKQIRVFVVTGVIQAQCMDLDSNLARAIRSFGKVKFVALRISDNKFTGEKTTDTGNRLFNTTDLD